MTTRFLLGTLLLVLLLATMAAAKNRMSGYLKRISPTGVEIRARYYPKAPFTVNQSTSFYCHHERVPADFLRVGDSVTVAFHAKAGRWIAEKVTVEANKKDCSARMKNRTVPTGSRTGISRRKEMSYEHTELLETDRNQ
jgi:hypothetical protein